MKFRKWHGGGCIVHIVDNILQSMKFETYIQEVLCCVYCVRDILYTPATKNGHGAFPQMGVARKTELIIS